MIFNDKLIFVHIGKTGGMSCSRFLLRNLKTPIYNCHQKSLTETRKLKIDGVIPRTSILRHCTLSEALVHIKSINGKGLEDFVKVVAVIRHPYTLEYSFYKHLQKPHVRKRRKDNARLLELSDGDFSNFVAQAGYHRRDFSQDEFVRVDSEIPACVELIRFEQLAHAFPRAVMGFLKEGATYRFPHRGRTQYDQSIRDVLTDEVRELIYKKHKFMFDSGLYSTTL